jgi:hypothetical protein
LQTSFRDSPSQRSSLRWFFHRRSLGPLRFQSAYSGMVGQHGKYSLDCAYYRLWFLHRRHNHTIQCSAQLSRDRIPSVRGIDICRERTFRRLVRRDLPTFCKLHIKPVLIRAAGATAFPQIGHWPRQFAPWRYCSMLHASSLHLLQSKPERPN